MLKNGCEAGCIIFTGGEIKHHPDCQYYPNSLSKMYDDLKSKQTKTTMKAVIEKLKDLKNSYERQAKMTPVAGWPGTEKEHREHYEGLAREYEKAILVLKKSQGEEAGVILKNLSLSPFLKDGWPLKNFIKTKNKKLCGKKQQKR